MARKYIKNRRGWPRPPQKKDRELVLLHTRINGEHTIAISRRLLEQTNGMPFVRRVDRICARTGLGYNEVSKALKPSAKTDVLARSRPSRQG